MVRASPLALFCKWNFPMANPCLPSTGKLLCLTRMLAQIRQKTDDKVVIVSVSVVLDPNDETTTDFFLLALFFVHFRILQQLSTSLKPFAESRDSALFELMAKQSKLTETITLLPCEFLFSLSLSTAKKNKFRWLMSHYSLLSFSKQSK